MKGTKKCKDTQKKSTQIKIKVLSFKCGLMVEP